MATDLKDTLRTALKSQLSPGFSDTATMAVLDALAVALDGVQPSYAIGTGAPNGTSPRAAVGLTIYIDRTSKKAYMGMPVAVDANWYSLGGSATTPDTTDLLGALMPAPLSGYQELTKSAGLLTSSITWTDSDKLTKMDEVSLSYNEAGELTVATKKTYDGAGLLLSTRTGTVARDGAVTSIVWVNS